MMLVEMNSYAVAGMQLGKYDDAIRFFKEALQRMQGVSEAEFEQDKTADVVASILSIPILTECQCETIKMQSPSNLFTFYPRAFQLAYSRPEDATFPQILVTLLYNLALATHVKCIDNPARTTPRYQNSVLKLYQHGMNLARAFLTPQDTSILCVQLALANNLGFFYSELGHFQETRESVRELVQLLHQTSQNMISPEDFGIFFESACIHMDHGAQHLLCLAPAA